MRFTLVVLLMFVLGVFQGVAQKHLVVLKNEKVLLRLYPGDEFIFKLKGSKAVRRSYVNNLNDTSILAHETVVPFHQIDRIYFRRSNLLNVVGGLLVVGGGAYFLIDQFNVVVVQGEDASIDRGVAVTSATMVGVGLPLMLLKKKYVRVRGKYRIRTIDKGSGFYRPDIRRDADNYLSD